MRIELKQQSQPVIDFSIYGSVFQIGDLVIDTALRQEDAPVTIELLNDGGVISEGGPGAYVAQIQIPARTYSENESVDENGNIVTDRVALPIDTNGVKVTLWPSF